jgi:hypothetical protein
MPLGSAVSAGVHTSAAVTTDSASAHAIGQAVDGAQGPLVQQTPNFMDMYAPEHYKQKYARNIEDERLVPPGALRSSIPNRTIISRHSLMDAGYGSFGHSLTEADYQYMPTRSHAVTIAYKGTSGPKQPDRMGPQPSIDDGVSEFAQIMPIYWLK